jgi:hypothetical protein
LLQAFRKVLFARSETFAKALKEMIVQAEAGRVAAADLQEIHSQLKKEFMQFWDHYQQRHQAHDALLQAFPQLLQKVLRNATKRHFSIIVSSYLSISWEPLLFTRRLSRLSVGLC